MSRHGKHGAIPAVDSCDECGEQATLTVLDRNAAETGEWVCDDCSERGGQ